MSDYFGKETPKLGFGLMRLPKKGLHTDIEQVKHMGFSFHAGPRLLDRLLREHPEVDFVQLHWGIIVSQAAEQEIC